jgi:hypothetical protein
MYTSVVSCWKHQFWNERKRIAGAKSASSPTTPNQETCHQQVKRLPHSWSRCKLAAALEKGITKQKAQFRSHDCRRLPPAPCAACRAERRHNKSKTLDALIVMETHARIPTTHSAAPVRAAEGQKGLDQPASIPAFVRLPSFGNRLSTGRRFGSDWGVDCTCRQRRRETVSQLVT